MQLLRKNFTPVLIFFLALFARFGYLLFFHQFPELSALPAEIDSRAVDLISAKTIAFPHAWASFYVLLAPFYKFFDLLGLLNQRVILFVLLQNLLAAVGVALFFVLAKRLLRSTAAATAAAILLAIYFPFIYLNSLILSESFYTFFLISASLLLTAKFSKKKFAIAGFLLGLALVSRSALVPFVPLLAAWLVLIKKLPFKVVGYLLPSLLLVVVLVSVVNYKIGQDPQFSFSGNTGINLTLTQCKYKKITYRGSDGDSFFFAPPAFIDSNLPMKTTQVPFYKNSYYISEGLKCLWENPSNLVTNLGSVKNIYHSIFYPLYDEGETIKKVLTGWKVVSVALTASFFSYPLLKKDDKNYWYFFFLLTSLYLAVYLANPGEERYFVPYFWVVTLYGVGALRLFFRRFFRG